MRNLMSARRSFQRFLLPLVLLVSTGCASRAPQPVAPEPASRATPPPRAESIPFDAALEAHRAAQELFDQGRFSDAVSEAERAVALAPERPEHHLLLGRALSERIHQIPVFNKLPMAHRIHDAFVRAVELDPHSVEGHTALARYYSEAPPVAGGDPAKAEHHARRLLELDAATGHRMLAKLYTLWQRPEEAEHHRRLAEELEKEVDEKDDTSSELRL